MVVDVHLDAALDSIDYFYARMFRDWPQAVTRTHETFTLAYSGTTRLTGANHLWPRTPEAITPAALEAARSFFAPYCAAWSVVYADVWSPYAGRLLADLGYYLSLIHI